MSLEFTEHGCFHVQLRGNILVLQIEGAWNYETALAYQDAIAEAIKPVMGSRWAVLTLMDEWELCTPDSELVLFDIVKNAVKQGLVKEAVVNNSGVIKLELFSKYQNVELDYNESERFKRHIYSDQPSAITWLAEMGFGFDKPV